MTIAGALITTAVICAVLFGPWVVAMQLQEIARQLSQLNANIVAISRDLGLKVRVIDSDGSETQPPAEAK